MAGSSTGCVQYHLLRGRSNRARAAAFASHDPMWDSAPPTRKADPLAETETYDEQQEREWLAAAARLTEKQLRTAVDLCTRVMGQDARASEGALVSGVVQALAINLSTVRRKR
jgi:hypothetical protein